MSDCVSCLSTPTFLPVPQPHHVYSSLPPFLKHRILECRLHISFAPLNAPLRLVPFTVYIVPKKPVMIVRSSGRLRGPADYSEGPKRPGLLPTTVTSHSWSGPGAQESGAGCSGTISVLICPILLRSLWGLSNSLPAKAPGVLTFEHDGLPVAFLLLLSEELVAGCSAGHKHPEFL